jgi:hypothetical protein
MMHIWVPGHRQRLANPPGRRTHEALKAEWLENPEVRAAYEALRPEFE